ncbi:MAG: AMP-binding protein [Pseudomonadota bacterium]
MNIANWLYQTALTAPDSPALLSGETLIADYDRFASRAAAIANRLTDEFGVKPDDHIGLYGKNSTAYLELVYGILWAGAVAVPVNAKLHEKEADWIFGNAETVLNFVSHEFDTQATLIKIDDFAAGLRKTDFRTSPPILRTDDDLAWLFYTSGTTGQPKGVMLTHGNIIAMSLCYPVDVDEPKRKDAMLYAAPISHGAGMYNFIHTRVGARHVVPDSAGFDPSEIIELAPRLENVSMFAAPTMVKRLITASEAVDYDGTGIKTIVYGGGPMYKADIELALAQYGNRFAQIYGQGESPMTITSLPKRFFDEAENHPEYGNWLGSTGPVQSAVEVRVTGEDGEPLAPGNPGEVEVRGPTVMAGYWKNAEATASAIVDGWLRTGDVGSLDAYGYLTLTDRSKDVIISGGSNVYPREVEELLLRHDDVNEVSVVGAPDPEWGEVIVAFVVSTEDATELEPLLDALCRDSIARFKRPKHYHFVAELPKNNYGKVLKTELRARLKLLQAGS